MKYEFNWSVLWSGQSGGWLLQGLLTTLGISTLAWLLAVAVWGLLFYPYPYPSRVREGEPSSPEERQH